MPDEQDQRLELPAEEDHGPSLAMPIGAQTASSVEECLSDTEDDVSEWDSDDETMDRADETMDSDDDSDGSDSDEYESDDEPPGGASEEHITHCTTLSQFKKINGLDAKCNICIEDLRDDDYIRWLPCFHFFHQDCVVPWLLRNRSCPECRTNITVAYTVA